MANWDNSRWTYAQVLQGGTGIYYQKDDLLRYSAEVKTMQGKLNTAGYNCGTPDGKFGGGTDTAVRNFQRAKRLTVDGKAGKGTLQKLDSSAPGGGETTSAAVTLKKNHGALITTYANQYNIDVNVLGAFILVESSGSGFSNGKVKIRLENHHFIKYSSSDYKDKYFTYGNPTYTGHKYRKNVKDSWITCHTSQTQENDAFNFAKTLNENAAYMSISMGLGQIMGFNHSACGFTSAKAMYTAFAKGEAEQIKGMIMFIASNSKLLTACRDKNYRKIAEYYNGSGNVSDYAPKLEAAYTYYKNA